MPLPSPPCGPRSWRTKTEIAKDKTLLTSNQTPSGSLAITARRLQVGLIQGPQLRDFTKESLKFFQGTSKLIVLAELWGIPTQRRFTFEKRNAPKEGHNQGMLWVD